MASRNDAEAIRVFAEVVRRYGDADPKPALPEEARRFRIQAEAALRDKKFEDAVDSYDVALRLAPWWPEGRFNRAMILAELKEYGEAVLEMRRFLALAPAHPQARAAQDQIYRWESAAPR